MCLKSVFKCIMGSTKFCESLPTHKDIYRPYEEYYRGDRDGEKRRNGEGENHWSGAESLEWYIGHFTRDTMHGLGDYRWRFKGPDGTFQTYEGYFYVNTMHGYGTVSYDDGRRFKGLFKKNHRWGPGVMRHMSQCEDVGLWYGSRLLRLAWKPPGFSVVPDLQGSPEGLACIEQFRVVLEAIKYDIPENNPAFELLKSCGAEPQHAQKEWPKLYPRNCTDEKSKVFPKEMFQNCYYGRTIQSLQSVPEKYASQEDFERELYYAWNNDKIIIDLMQHAYKHHYQLERLSVNINLHAILSGTRNAFKPHGKYELDCRLAIMASYIGNLYAVAKLINECNVCPDISDCQGNTALMYAVCGDHINVIDFLIQAGAEVDCYNDACCTPLAMALIRYVAAYYDLSTLDTVSAIVPPMTGSPKDKKLDTDEGKPKEWNMLRTQVASSPPTGRSNTKVGSTHSGKTAKGSNSGISPSERVRKIAEEIDVDLNIEMGREYLAHIFRDYDIASNAILPGGGNRGIPYIFELTDIMCDIIAKAEDKKGEGNKKSTPQPIKQSVKPSRVEMNIQNDDESSMNSAERHRIEKLERIKATISCLLSHKAVIKKAQCPQPPLCYALTTACTELVRTLTSAGADVNESYPQFLNYSPLQIAITRPYNKDTLELIETLLQCGANANARITCTNPDTMEMTPGPTLLHVVLEKQTENPDEEQIRDQLLVSLLNYGCDPVTFYKGSSAVENAMLKDLDLLDIFLTNPNTNLNSIINGNQHTILVKMFSAPFCHLIAMPKRLQVLTDLLLYGADPFLPCQDGEQNYDNLFVFTKKFLDENPNIYPPSPITAAPTSEARDRTQKQNGKKKSKTDVANPSRLAPAVILINYAQAVNLIQECARLLYNRWIQASLMRDLLYTVDKFKHRAWHMIIKEHGQCRKAARLWLNPRRCLEMWEIWQATGKPIFKNKTVLQKLLCIIEFYNSNIKLTKENPMIRVEDYETIGQNVKTLMQEYKTNPNIEKAVPWRRAYVKPELTAGPQRKYQVCYECCLPYKKNSEMQRCPQCRLVFFCNMECMKTSVSRAGHPCSDWLMKKYFPPSPTTSPTDLSFRDKDNPTTKSSSKIDSNVVAVTPK